jgi:hypothetical protein
MKLLIALVVWIAALAGAAELSSTVAAKYKSSKSSAVSAGSSGGSPGAAPFDPSSVKAADRLSLFKPANLGKALKIAHAHFPRDSQLNDATIYPGYLVLTFVRAGNNREVLIDANGAYNGATSAGSSGQPSFSIKQLNAGTPSKLVKEIAASAHVRESGLNYMILSANSGSGLKWLIYPIRTGAVQYYQASVTGRDLVAWTANGPRPLR